jgi:hypothetical protein
MNCFLEAVAALWLDARRRMVAEPVEEEVLSAQDGLEQCRRNMEGRQRELAASVDRLNREAVAKMRQRDPGAARAKLLERRRLQKRLDRLRHGLGLVDTQLEAIKTSELDKEIMLTIKASTSAMKKAGITLGVEEVESVMTELDEQMREVRDVTSAFAAPLQGAGPEDADLDAELQALLYDTGDLAETEPPVVLQRQDLPIPAPAELERPSVRVEPAPLGE